MNKILLILALLIPVQAAAQVTAASCSQSDVQSAINTATQGQTVTVPDGSCTWTNFVTISGKGIVVQSNGNTPPRVVAISNTLLSLSSTSSQTLTLVSDNAAGTLPSLSNGQSLLISELGVAANYIKGTVSSYNSGTGVLTINYVSHGGTCGTPAYPSDSPSNCMRWMIHTQPAHVTTIINNSNNDNGLFTISEDTAFNTKIQGFDFEPGTYYSHAILVNYTSGGQPVLITNNYAEEDSTAGSPPSGNGDIFDFVSHRGVVWNNSIVSHVWQIASLGGADCKDSTNATGNSWTTISKFGTNDTGEVNNLYIETNDFHGFNYPMGNDDNCRMVQRYNFLDNSGLQGTHGADTSNYGQRYFEAYNNVAVFFTDGGVSQSWSNTVYNLQNYVFLRGGTGVLHDNTFPAITSVAWGSKPDVNATIENLQRSSGPNPCWGALNGGGSGGAHYHTPRQPGFGYVTGSGTSSYTGTSPNPIYTVSGANDSVTYVGDIEPFYVWSNNRAPLTTTISDYGGSACNTPDTATNYILSGTNYFPNTSKPSYTAAAYPNPLTTGGTTYTLSTSVVGSGSISGCAANYSAGAAFSCTVTPSGSVLNSVTGCTGSGTTTYAGSMPAANCTVTATFLPPAPTGVTANITIKGNVGVQ